ncbi:hypothetical protein BN2475_910003 [Paraburkholderia ribeironis]|uniref:Uncharacterized protein n=1 Tax=Paraburkholderia ribeironis TaxID=1247936 RepID=A0A1N7SM15_9BURK|nr:hypothetical protein BN2475_910003 [Paraburkholderia ribeironis]
MHGISRTASFSRKKRNLSGERWPRLFGQWFRDLKWKAPVVTLPFQSQAASRSKLHPAPSLPG